MKNIWKRILDWVWKRILDWVMFALTGRGEIADEAVDAGILDLSGQGRDGHGI